MTERKSIGSIHVKVADAGTATAIFSRFGGPPDSDGDITEPGAFTNGAVVAVSAYNHGSWSSALPVGKATIRVLPDRAEADLEFFLDTTGGRETFATIKQLGPLTQWSYGFDVVDSAPGKWKGRPVRILKRLDVFEVSPVLRGAGRDTMTVAGSVKRAGGALSPAERAEVDAIALKLRAWDEHDDEQAVRAEVDAIALKLELATIVDALRDGMARDARRHHYAESGPPPAADEHAASDVLRLCAAELETDLPLLRWFRPETAAEKRYAQKHGARDWVHFHTPVPARGVYARDVRTVWILADLDRETMLSTVAHEVAHAAGADEDEAQRYEQRWAENLPALN